MLVEVILRVSVVPRGQAIGLLATKGIPLRIAVNREKGRASWRQFGLPAQSLPRRRFRRALRAFICKFFTHVCIYVYMSMCADMYICIYMCMCVCICICMRLYTCACACVCVCIFVHRFWVAVSVLQRVDGVMDAHMCSCTYVCVCIWVWVYICGLFCSECCMHFGTGVLGTSAWAGVYATQVCFYANVHICERTRCRLCTYVYIYTFVDMHTYVYW